MSAGELFGFKGTASPQIALLQQKCSAMDQRLEVARAQAAEAESWRDEALEARTRLPEAEDKIAQLENELRQTERRTRELKAETARLDAAQQRNDELIAAAEEFAAWYVGCEPTEKTRRAALKLLHS
jgi:septal ring factor EnvC (AmiA/AmiB activator)